MAVTGAPSNEHVYFTWPDRRFAYSCQSCGACCKGHGIGLDVVAGELTQLTRKRPELTAFVRQRGDTITAFNPRDRCWFLASDGLCRIETEDGRAAKPVSCRLFPFNRVFTLGAYTIVDVNSVVCPLRVATENDTPCDHAEVMSEIRMVRDPAVVGTRLPARDALAEGEAFVGAERAIASVLFAGVADAGDVEAAWGVQADAGAYAREGGHAHAAFMAIVGAGWRVPSRATASNALWITPSLRFNELFGPRQYAPRSSMSPVLARMWLAWLGFAALGEQLAQRALGMQELTTLWTEQAPLMHAVARWTDVPLLRPDAVSLPGVDPGNVVRSLAQAFLDNKQRAAPLAKLVAALPADPVRRVTALKSADALMRAAFSY